VTIKIIVLQDSGFDDQIKNAWEVTLSPFVEKWIYRLIEENDARTPAGIIETELDMSAEAYKE
jgi:hypothetical protein